MSFPSPYIPFESGHPGFKIALSPLDPARWIEPDERLAARLGEKERLDAEDGADTFRAAAGTAPAQAETLSLLVDHLGTHHPELYQNTENSVRIAPAGRNIKLTGAPPLQIAGRLVDDDLCLMIRDREGSWRLQAASLHFPSHWSLAEKFGRSMAGIHEPVPGFADQMETRVARIFDHLRPETPVWRLNWSLHDDATLPLPDLPEGPRFEKLDGEALLTRAFLRVERQTLRKLPKAGAIVFTIKTYIDPLTLLLDKGGPALARDLHDALAAMNEAQLAYKGLTRARARVLAALAARMT